MNEWVLKKRMSIALALLASLVGCSSREPPSAPAAASPFKLAASIHDIMAAEVDPSADYLWEAVGTISTKDGVEERQPRTEAEWLQARHMALILIEATNLLVMDGRKVVQSGGKIQDQEEPGAPQPQDIQKRIDADHASFVGFAHALNDVGMQMLAAIDGKNVQGMLDAGGALDEVCEACHQKYWYPSK